MSTAFDDVEPPSRPMTRADDLCLARASPRRTSGIVYCSRNASSSASARRRAAGRPLSPRCALRPLVMKSLSGSSPRYAADARRLRGGRTSPRRTPRSTARSRARRSAPRSARPSASRSRARPRSRGCAGASSPGGTAGRCSARRAAAPCGLQRVAARRAPRGSA